VAVGVEVNIKAHGQAKAPFTKMGGKARTGNEEEHGKKKRNRKERRENKRREGEREGGFSAELH